MYSRRLMSAVNAGPLFPCQASRCSVAEAVVSIMQLSKNSNWSKTSTSKLLQLLSREILPEVNHMPDSFHAAAQLVSAYGVGYSISPCCQNDCCIFQNELEGADQCPKCGDPAVDSMGKPNKQFRHVSLAGALQQFFGNQKTAAQMLAPAPNADTLTDVWGAHSTFPPSSGIYSPTIYIE